MKVKADFITNSSSTNYLTFIPTDFDVEKFLPILKDLDSYKDLLEWGENDDDIDADKDVIERKIKRNFKQLIKSGTIEEYEDDTMFIVAEMLENLDLIVPGDVGYGGAGSGIIFNLNNEHSNKTISVIKAGGWGVKYGGWGHEIKE